MKKILIIEDDQSIAELQKDYLVMSGYDVTVASDGKLGLSLINSEKFDLIILDLMLPHIDGFSILSEIAEKKTIPVLVVSAKSEEMYKIKGLNLGADDYITKPFGMGELVARVKSHINRYEKFSSVPKNDEFEIRGLTVNKTDRRVFLNNEEIILKQKEFDLLCFMMQNPNRVFDKETLYEKVWGYDAMSDSSTVTVHIARIREKIEENPAKPQYIETVWGVGYRFKV